MTGKALLLVKRRVLFRIKQRHTGVGGRMGVMAVNAVDPLHGVVGMPRPEHGGAEVMTLQADLLLGKLEHKFIVLGMGIMTFVTIPSFDWRMQPFYPEPLR